MEFLRQSERPAEVRRVEFLTASPGVSSDFQWVRIEQQERSMEISRIEAHRDAGERHLEATTRNIAQVVFQLGAVPASTDGPPAAPVRIRIDGEDLAAAPDAATIRLKRTGGSWSAVGAANLAHKHPERCGPFKEAFRNNFILIYSTGGTPEENAWSEAKARYDAETFYYRGNGAPDILPDLALLPGASGWPPLDGDRNIILYGNADTNRAWPVLLGESPIEVRRSQVKIGQRTLRGDDMACLFIYPRPGSDTASVGIVSGTGMPPPLGVRLTDQLPYFISGVAYPDWIVIGSEMLEQHSQGVRAAGFFGSDWSISADSAWRDLP
jgi:hypothetical protein